MNKKEIEDRVINFVRHRKDRCFCMLCEKEDVQVGSLSPWFSPEMKLVTVYASCSDCAKLVTESGQVIGAKLCDKIERNLLNKYPELYDKLPKNYQPH